MAGLRHTFQAVALPDLQREPEAGRLVDALRPDDRRPDGAARAPAGAAPPYVQWQAPLVWTTLSLTLHADGRAEYALSGASRFPRHWVYDAGGQLTHKSGLTDFGDWMAVSFGRRTPWGDEDSPALVTAVETALEHALSVQLMHGAARPRVSSVPAGAELVRQGEPGSEIYLVLDGVMRWSGTGTGWPSTGPAPCWASGPLLEGGTRTSTLVAVTPCRVASVARRAV